MVTTPVGFLRILAFSKGVTKFLKNCPFRFRIFNFEGVSLIWDEIFQVGNSPSKRVGID